MNQENCVLFKGTKKGITLQLSEDADFETIKQHLERKVEDASKFFEGVKTSIFFKGKILTEEEQTELLQIISDKTSINISFVRAEEPDTPAPIDPPPTLPTPDSMVTKYHKGSVRSGQVIEFAGSVVVLGDVNPGAIVRAEGNIIILGALKGLAHAGSSGRTDAFITALSLIPVQLRIADIITRFPDLPKKKKPKKAEYAYVDGGQIYVVPLE